MDDVKVSLSIELPGATMLKEEECLRTTRKVWKDQNGKTHSKKVIEEDFDKMDANSFFLEGDKKRGIKPQRIVFHTRKSIPAIQNLNIRSEAYVSMTSADNCPEWMQFFIWKKLSKRQRLDAHMNRIAEYLGGKVLEYHVFED